MNTAHAGCIYNLHNECLRVSPGVQATYAAAWKQAWDEYDASWDAAEAAYQAEEERAWCAYTEGKAERRKYYTDREAAWKVREAAVLAAEHKRNAQLDAAWLAAASWEPETP